MSVVQQREQEETKASTGKTTEKAREFYNIGYRTFIKIPAHR